MPVPTRDIASERYTVTSKSHVEPEKPKLLKYSFIGGVIMVDDGSGPRVATAEEIEQLTGGVMCLGSIAGIKDGKPILARDFWAMPDNEEGDL
jgi:hypothetical protein